MGNFMRNEPLDGSGEKGNEFVDEIFFFSLPLLVNSIEEDEGEGEGSSRIETL